MPPRISTQDRILDGAMRAISRHGLAKMAMRDVGACAGVARGTVYRYFPNREALLAELARREGQRFFERWHKVLSEADGEERVRVAFEYPARFARDYPVLQRLLETDPDYVLQSIRRDYAAIRATVAHFLGPILADNELARRDVVSVDLLVEFATRVLISGFLFPAPDREEFVAGLTSMHRVLHDGVGA